MAGAHIIGWTEDDEVDGAHCMVPYTCEQYIADLERLLQCTLGADNMALADLQRAYRRLKSV